MMFKATLGRKEIPDLTIEEIQGRRTPVPDNRVTRYVMGSIPRSVRVTETTFTARDGYDVPVRVHTPPGRGPWPVVVFYHGGGWAIGSTAGYDSLCGHIADQAGALVLNVDYRMAPEHKAPQAALDCVDALRWAGAEAASYGGDTSRLAVCGDSAGGNLSAVVAQVVRDEGGPQIAYQALIYPGVDLTMSHPSISEFADGPVLTRRDIEGFVSLYLDGSGVDPKDPVVSPLWAGDLSGLPPALVQTGDVDPLRDEGRAYAARLADAGVPVRATNYLGGPHGFYAIPRFMPCAAQARLELVTELGRALH